MSTAKFDPTKIIGYSSIDWTTLTHVVPHPATQQPTRKQLNQKFKQVAGKWTLVDMTPAEFENIKNIYKKAGVWKTEQENASKLKFYWGVAKQELIGPIQALLEMLPKKIAAYKANKAKIEAKISALPPTLQSKYVPAAQSLNRAWEAEAQSNLNKADAIIAKVPASARTALSGMGGGMGALPLALPIIGVVGGVGAYLVYKYLDISNKKTDAAIALQKSLNERIDGEYKTAMAVVNNPAASAADRQAAMATVRAISENARSQQLAISTPASMSLFGMPPIVPIVLVGGGVVLFFLWKKKALLPTQEISSWLTNKK